VLPDGELDTPGEALYMSADFVQHLKASSSKKRAGVADALWRGAPIDYVGSSRRLGAEVRKVVGRGRAQGWTNTAILNGPRQMSVA